jgi:hypothetical protein
MVRRRMALSARMLPIILSAIAQIDSTVDQHRTRLRSDQ